MSFYTFIVLEVKKEVYSRLFNYWVNQENDYYHLWRPRKIFDSGGTFVMSYEKNHAPEIDDIEDWLQFTLGMDHGDFHIEMYPETYSFDPEGRTRDEWGFDHGHYDRGGSLEPSFVVSGWDEIDGKEGILLTPYTEVYRRPEPESGIEQRLDNIEKLLAEISDSLRRINENMPSRRIGILELHYRDVMRPAHRDLPGSPPLPF